MFSYYGSKTGKESCYPKPIYDKIIEPFAGTAKYSLYHFEKDVLITDTYKDLIDVWLFLKECSKKDILSLPVPKGGEFLSDYNFDCNEAKLLLGFMIGFGSQSPRNKVSPHFTKNPNRLKNQLKKIANDLYKIKHWKIELKSFFEIENEKATWFIDPPYQFGGHAYVESNKKLDFNKLSEYCKDRQGQTIVCENTKADWLDFKPMFKATNRYVTTEAIWSNLETPFDNIQLSIF